MGRKPNELYRVKRRPVRKGNEHFGDREICLQIVEENYPDTIYCTGIHCMHLPKEQDKLQMKILEPQLKDWVYKKMKQIDEGSSIHRYERMSDLNDRDPFFADYARNFFFENKYVDIIGNQRGRPYDRQWRKRHQTALDMRFTPHFSNKRLSQITFQMIHRNVYSITDVGQDMRNHYIATIRHFYKGAMMNIDDHRIQYSPAEMVKMRAVKAHDTNPREPLSWEQMNQIVDWADKNLPPERAIIFHLLRAGLRPGEAVTTRFQDRIEDAWDNPFCIQHSYDLNTDSVEDFRIKGLKTELKGVLWKVVFLTFPPKFEFKESGFLFENRKYKGQPVSPGQLRRFFIETASKAGVELNVKYIKHGREFFDKTLYSFRHGAFDHLDDTQLPPHIIQQLHGHVTMPENSRRYTHKNGVKVMTKMRKAFEMFKYHPVEDVA